MSYSKKTLLTFYEQLLIPRLFEERMLILLRQGKISKWFSGIGQEAIAVGATLAMNKNEYILPLHRNLGVFTARALPLDKLFAQFQGKAYGFTNGRDRSFHFGTNEHKIVGMISHLGPQLSVADGIALAAKLKNEKEAVLAFSGEGGTSEGDFHEAVNLAAVWDLPVIFLIENNGYALSTSTEEQFRCKQLADKAKGYGIRGLTIDGNNLLEVYETVHREAQKCRKSNKPVIIECMTFRVRGHEEASGVKYVPTKLIEKAKANDPIVNFEKYLKRKKLVSRRDLANIREKISADILAKTDSILADPSSLIPDSSKEIKDVYRTHTPQIIIPDYTERKLRYVDAISEALDIAMAKNSELILMGQDIAQYGGVFKITEGFLKKFGRARVRNTPLCESAVLGAGLGLSIKGMKSVIEMQFADFVSCGMTQIINNLAKSHYRWGQNADVVVRLPTGAGVAAGPFHSQSNEAWFFHTPGLKIVYPAFPEDAKGLLLSAIEDPNPVMFFEHKALYRSLEGPVPAGYYNTEIGKARVVKDGHSICIITYGAGVHWALEAAKNNPEISLLILDLRTLLPLDWESIEAAVKATGKVLILHEDTLTGGIGAEISAQISEKMFNYLDAPIIRCASLDTPIPFAKELEINFLAKKSLSDEINKLFKS